MKTLADLKPLFTAGIFFVATLSFLLVGFNSLLDAKIKPLEKQIGNHISEVKTAIQGLTERIDRLYESPPKKKEL